MLPKPIRGWTLTTLREKLIKIGAKVVSHAKYLVFQLAEVAVPRHLFAAIVERIGRLRLAVTTEKPPVPLQEVLPAHIAKILHKTASQRTAAEQSTLVGYYRSTDAELGRLQRAADEFIVPADARALAAQDIAWALMNSPGFLFNH